MGREQERILRKLENNPIVECNKVRQRYCPNLFRDFAGTKDLRNLSYTDYSNKGMLGTVFYKGIAGITSMQSMTYEFNEERVVKNLYRFMGEKEKEYLPHAVTVNEYLERLNPDELQKVQQKQVYGLIRSKAFYDARFQKKWLVIVDGTQTYSGSRKLNENCLERHYNKGTQEETVNYHCDVLEAKIVLGRA
ncbi:MAG: transposase family protein [Lachnospiraceae bacterium]|nr:transposase family protein [Lachnospiraceae bacterium]